MGSELRGQAAEKGPGSRSVPTALHAEAQLKSPVSPGAQGRNRSLWVTSSSPLSGELLPGGVEKASDYIRSYGGGTAGQGTVTKTWGWRRGGQCGWVEVGLPWHFGRSSDSGRQMSPHTRTHRGHSSTGTSTGLTQNDVPNDNMQIIDYNQGPQTCTGPQGREQGRFQVRAAPATPTQSFLLPHLYGMACRGCCCPWPAG